MNGSSGCSASSSCSSRRSRSQLAAAQGRVLVAGVLDDDVGPAHLAAPARGWPAGSARGRGIASGCPGGCGRAGRGRRPWRRRCRRVGQAQALHRRRRRSRRGQTREQCPQLVRGCPRRGGRRRPARRSSRRWRGAGTRCGRRRSCRTRGSRRRGRRSGRRRPWCASVEPVSTTTISSTRSAAESRQAGRLSSSFLTIMHSETRGRGPAGTVSSLGGACLPSAAWAADSRRPVRLPTWSGRREVVVEELLCVDAQVGEGAAANVVDEHIQGH